MCVKKNKRKVVSKVKKRKDGIYNRIGIYGIKNLLNGKMYIGQTGMNFGDRWDSHRSLLNNGKHTNEHLQRAWQKYGCDNFEFMIIDECSVDLLDEKEKYYIKKYKDLNLSYNMQDGGQKSNKLGVPLSEEAKRKIGEKNRINSTGRKVPESVRAKMSNSHKGMKYKPMSDAGKRNLSIAHQKSCELNPKKLTVSDVLEIRRLFTDEHKKYSEIARTFNVSGQCISDICNYKRWKQVP